MKLLSIRLTSEEEEGGMFSAEFLPTGFVRVDGRGSHGGYTPPLPNGWYRFGDRAALQELFDLAARKVQARPDGAPTAAVLEKIRTSRWPSKIGAWLIATARLAEGKPVTFDEYQGHKEYRPPEPLFAGWHCTHGVSGLERVSDLEKPPPAGEEIVRASFTA